MTHSLPIEELRRLLAEASLHDQGATGAEAIYIDFVDVVLPYADTPAAPALKSKLLGIHEQLRQSEPAPRSIDTKFAHLILLAMVLKEHGAAAVVQGIAARRAGASWDEVRDVVHLVSLLHGLPGASRGDEFLTALTERERKERVAGAVAAYG